MNKQATPLYGIVSDLTDIPICRGMQQALPSILDLQEALNEGHVLLVGGYEVLLLEYLRKTEAASKDGKLGEEAMTIDKSTRCPICGEGSLWFRTNDGSHWSCGTRVPDYDGEFEAGMECEKTVFRNGFMRCRELVEKVTALQFTDCGANHVSCVMPRELLNDLLEECD